jgi:hypothetical protein
MKSSTLIINLAAESHLIQRTPGYRMASAGAGDLRGQDDAWSTVGSTAAPTIGGGVAIANTTSLAPATPSGNAAAANSANVGTTTVSATGRIVFRVALTQTNLDKLNERHAQPDYAAQHDAVHLADLEYGCGDKSFGVNNFSEWYYLLLCVLIAIRFYVGMMVTLKQVLLQAAVEKGA